MTDTELRELDTWIHRHIFEADLYVGLKKRGLWYRPNAKGYTDKQSEAGRYTRAEAKSHEYPHDEPVTIHEFEPEHYTTDPAAAMSVLEKCAVELASKDATLEITYAIPECLFMVAHDRTSITCVGQSNSLPLAICLFAKKLFSK